MTIFHWVGLAALIVTGATCLGAVSFVPAYLITRMVLRWREGR